MDFFGPKNKMSARWFRKTCQSGINRLGVSREGLVQTFNGSVFSIEMHRDEREQNINKYKEISKSGGNNMAFGLPAF